MIFKNLFALLLVFMSGCATSQLSERLNAATVSVIALDCEGMKVVESSGFFVRADGLLITCNHSIAHTEPLAVILANGSRHQIAEVVDTDEENDLALLRIERVKVVPLPLNSKTPERGKKLRAGSTFGVADAESRGTQQGLVVFVSPSVRVGASGGMLVDDLGVVGVISGGFDDDSGECVAIPASHAVAFLARQNR
jgi:S1-C subfamily serine protease